MKCSRGSRLIIEMLNTCTSVFEINMVKLMVMNFKYLSSDIVEKYFKFGY